jgi:hypothetical protein
VVGVTGADGAVGSDDAEGAVGVVPGTGGSGAGFGRLQPKEIAIAAEMAITITSFIEASSSTYMRINRGACARPRMVYPRPREGKRKILRDAPLAAWWVKSNNGRYARHVPLCIAPSALKAVTMPGLPYAASPKAILAR